MIFLSSMACVWSFVPAPFAFFGLGEFCIVYIYILTSAGEVVWRIFYSADGNAQRRKLLPKIKTCCLSTPPPVSRSSGSLGAIWSPPCSADEPVQKHKRTWTCEPSCRAIVDLCTIIMGRSSRIKKSKFPENPDQCLSNLNFYSP